MLKVEIQSTDLRTLSFKYRNSEESVKEQTGWAYFYDRNGNVDPHPRAIAIRMAQGQVPYPLGTYTIHPQSLYVGDFNSVKVSPELKLIAPEKLKAAA